VPTRWDHVVVPGDSVKLARPVRGEVGLGGVVWGLCELVRRFGVAGENTVRAVATTANGGPKLDYLEI
jgi:hypothetical protein